MIHQYASARQTASGSNLIYRSPLSPCSQESRPKRSDHLPREDPTESDIDLLFPWSWANEIEGEMR
jgi:hypothetical protein